MKKVELAFLICGICFNLLYLTGNGLFEMEYIVIVAVLWLTATALQLSFHEMGHLIGGLISGYCLVFLNIGAVRLSYNQEKKLSISIGKSHGGQCVMEPRNSESRHYLCYNLGGIFTNLLISLAAGGLLLLDSHFANLLFINLTCVGVQKILLNGIPIIVKGTPSDAYVVKLLSNNKDVQKDYCMYLKLFASYYREDSIDCECYKYYRPIDVAEKELLYYREIQSLLAEMNQDR